MGARIAFLGDTLLGGDAQSVLDREGYDYPLAEIAPVVAGADLVVANLEGTRQPQRGRLGIQFLGRPREV